MEGSSLTEYEHDDSTQSSSSAIDGDYVVVPPELLESLPSSLPKRRSLSVPNIKKTSSESSSSSSTVAVTSDDCLSNGIVRRGMRPTTNKTSRDFIFYKQIGEGAFSTVYKTKEVGTEREYAIKVIVKAHVHKHQKTKSVVREKNVMALLSYVHGGHPFIVSLYCTFQDTARLYFALSYCSRGDLLGTLSRVTCFDVDITRFYTAEIIAALDYIHNCGVVHRDIKPENILIQASGHIAVTDFGSAKILAEEERMAGETRDKLNVETEEDREKRRATFVGTAQYVSPEMLSGDSVGIECDYWALGAIVYQMLSGQPPFRAVNDYHLMKKIQNLDFTFPPGFPEEALMLVKQLLVLDPEQRLGSKSQARIQEHAFFEGIDFETLPEAEPPKIHPYCPASMGEPAFYSDVVVEPEPGLDEKALKRLMMAQLTEGPKYPDMDPKLLEKFMPMNNYRTDELSSVPTPTAPPPGHEKVETQEERIARIRAAKMEKQIAENPYHIFAEENLILRSGLVDKKKGLFARRRMFLLTEGPHIYYIDPVRMEFKGEIPVCFNTRTEAKNFRTFFVHTPGRTYYLFDPERRAVEWCDAIDKVKLRYCKEPRTPEQKAADAARLAALKRKHRKKTSFLLPWTFFRRRETEQEKQERKEREEEQAKIKEAVKKQKEEMKKNKKAEKDREKEMKKAMKNSPKNKKK